MKAQIFLANAQDILPLLPQIDSIIIGGTWGDTKRVIELAIDRLKKGGRIVIDTILIETMYKTITTINESLYTGKFSSIILYHIVGEAFFLLWFIVIL